MTRRGRERGSRRLSQGPHYTPRSGGRFQSKHMPGINIFANTDWRNQAKPFGIKREDRRLHMYVIGRTGMGKTSLLQNMALNDIYGNEGVCFIDPHGDAVERLLDYIPPSRVRDTIYFNPADLDYPIGLNLLRQVEPERRHLLVSGLISIFSNLYAHYWQHRQEHILRNAILTLLEQGTTQTLVELHRLLSDWRFRNQVVANVRDPIVRSFWKNEFPKYLYSRGEGLATLLNKLGSFLTTPLVRNIVGQRERKVDFRRAMDDGAILLINLSKGKLGEDNAAFFGALVMLELQLAALSRADVSEHQRKDFYLYVDEFQSFIVAEGLDHMLSEARKFRLNVTLAHQYLGQLDESLRKAILGNVGTVAAFPVGPEDAIHLENLFFPPFTRNDLVDRPKYSIYLRMAMDGKSSRPFSATTQAPFGRFVRHGTATAVRNHSRDHWAQPRQAVERDVLGRAGPTMPTAHGSP